MPFSPASSLPTTTRDAKDLWMNKGGEKGKDLVMGLEEE